MLSRQNGVYDPVICEKVLQAPIARESHNGRRGQLRAGFQTYAEGQVQMVFWNISGSCKSWRCMSLRQADQSM